MKNAGLFVILFFRKENFSKSTCFLLAGLTEGLRIGIIGNYRPN